MPVRPVQHADLDGDGEPEVIAAGAWAVGAQRTLRFLDQERTLALGADGGWRATTNKERGVPLGDLPLAVDLDGDGRCEIVVSDAGAMPPLDGYRGVRLLDGVTGTTRWAAAATGDFRKRWAGGRAGAPDLDGDGVRELIAVSLFDGRDPPASPRDPDERRVYVDALSGKERPLAVGVERRVCRWRSLRESGSRSGGGMVRTGGRCLLSRWVAVPRNGWVKSMECHADPPSVLPSRRSTCSRRRLARSGIVCLV